MGTENEKPVKLHQLTPGTLLFGRYRISKILGEGGFGITYAATDEVLLQDVAIKEYFPSTIATRNTQSSTEIQTISSEEDEQFSKGKQDFLKEARTLARFPHDTGIVAVRDYFEENNTAYIVMELLCGTDLRTWLIDHGPMNAEQCFSLLSPIMTSLSHVHEQGLIHRDISPSNIMIMGDGSARLLDFGAARAINKSGDLTLSVLLKPGYSPEEQYRSKGVQGPWTDVYSLCATFYRMLTGMQPEDSLQRLLLDELKKPSELGIDVSPAVEAVLMKGLSINGKDRYQTMEALRDAFEKAFQEGIGPEETPNTAGSDEKSDGNSDKETGNPNGSRKTDKKNSLKKGRDRKEKTGSANQKGSPKKIIILIACLAAAAFLIRIPVIRFLQSSPVKTTSAAASAPGQNTSDSADTAASTDPSVTDNTVSVLSYPDDNGKLTKTILWGNHVNTSSNFSSSMKYMDIDTDAGTFNVSVVPRNLIVKPDVDPDTIILEFLDQFDVKIAVYGSYELDRDSITVSAPENSAVKDTYSGKDLYALSGELMFRLSFGSTGKDPIGALTLNNSRTNSAVLRSYYNYTEAGETINHRISGTLSGSSAFHDLQYAEISYVPKTKAGSVVLGFTDGGITKDAKISLYSSGYVSINYSKIQREYNGRTEVFDEYGSIRLNITNGYPYGFVLYDEDNKTYHYYQDFSKQ